MIWLYIGVFLFAGTHLFSILARPVRDRAKAWAGEKYYKMSYSLKSLVGVGLMFWGYSLTRGNGEMLYTPMEGARHITMLLALAGFIAISAAHGKGYIKLWLQNPMSVGIALWSTGHLLANGRTAVVWIFGTFLLIALLDIISNMARGNRPMHEPRVRSDLIAVGVGIALYAVLLLVFHPYVIGVRIVG